MNTEINEGTSVFAQSFVSYYLILGLGFYGPKKGGKKIDYLKLGQPKTKSRPPLRRLSNKKKTDLSQTAKRAQKKKD